MLILANDTATDYAVFGIGDDSTNETFGVTVPHRRNLSRNFYTLMDQVLVEGGLTFGEIDVLAVGVGPGSFTGVRVAVTTMKTLAQVTGKPLVAIGTLDIYAREAVSDGAHHSVVVLPSRKGEIYFQTFDATGSTGPPSVATFEALHEMVQELGDSYMLCGQTACLPDSFFQYHTLPQQSPSPAAFLELAFDAARKNAFTNPVSLTPVYAAPPAISRHKSR